MYDIAITSIYLILTLNKLIIKAYEVATENLF